MPGCRDGEGAGQREAHAGVADRRWLPRWTPAPVADGQRQEGQAGLQRAGAEHVLQVQRGEQEGPEQHGRGGEHHHDAAADGAVGEALHPQQRLRRCAAPAPRRRRARPVRRRRCRASASRSSPRCRPARGRRRARRGWRWRAARRAGRGRASAAARSRRARPAARRRRATRPTGRLMKKIARQSTSSVSVPPSSTPMAAPAPPTAPQTPSALARSRPSLNVVSDDRQRRGREHRGAEALAGAGGEQRRGAAGQRRGER